MGAFPWQAKPGVHKKLAWLAWLTIMACFVIASLITIRGAVQQRARPVRVTFFDAEEKVYLPDVQICLVDGNRGPSSEGDQSKSSGVGQGDFVLNAFDRALLLADGVPLASQYDITIENLLAGIGVNTTEKPSPDPKNENTELYYTEFCDGYEGFNTTVRSRFVVGNEPRPWPEYAGFEYTTKADEDLFDFVENETSIPYFYSIEKDRPDFPTSPIGPSILDFTRHNLTFAVNETYSQSGFLSPFGVLRGNPDQVDYIAGLVIGAIPEVGCLTFFMSLCPQQEQVFLSRVTAPIFISLRGTGPKFKYFGVSIGQHDYDAPLYADGVDIAYQSANLNSTLNLVVAPRYDKPLLSVAEMLGIKKAPVFNRYSYRLGSVLPTSDLREPTEPGNREIINFTLTLEISLSPRGVEHTEAQDPLFGVFGTIGGLWNFVPLFFGLLYAATPKEDDVLVPTTIFRTASKLVPSRCGKRIVKKEEDADVESAEGILPMREKK